MDTENDVHVLSLHHLFHSSHWFALKLHHCRLKQRLAHIMNIFSLMIVVVVIWG